MSSDGSQGPQLEVAGSRTEQIRALAAGLFSERGYSATTMSHIAEAAGVLPGSLYHHFESKEVIAVELLEELEAALIAVGARLTSERHRGRPDERLIELVSETMTVSYEHPAAVRLLMYEPPSVATERLRKAVTLRVPSLERLSRSTMNELAAMAGVTSSDARVTRVALGILSLNASSNFPHADPRQLAEQLCELVLWGATRITSEVYELDSSSALRIAKDAVAAWGTAPEDPEELTAPADRILAAGRIEFARMGVDATTVRDIAKTAGVTMGTLYRHTDSKFTLVRQIIDDYAGHFDQAMRAVLECGGSAAEILDAVAWVFVNASRRFRNESDMVKVGWFDRDDESSPYFQYFRATNHRLGLLQNLLERGVAEGSLQSIALAPYTASNIRLFMWLPYQDVGRMSIARAHAYLRHIMLNGFLVPRL